MGRLPQIMASEDKKSESFVRLEMRLHDLVLCPLNPLKVIDQKVAQMFVHFAVKYRLIQTEALKDLRDYNKTIIIAGLSDFLEDCSFFPFDNYNLPVSRLMFEGANNCIYQVWGDCSEAVLSEDEAASSGWARDGEGSEGAE